MNAPRVAAVIVNWNRAEDTLRCLASLRASTGVELSLHVVDNASSDGSCAAIELAFPEVEIIRNRANLGFAEGNNVAIRALVARGIPYLLLLNNDAIVVGTSAASGGQHPFAYDVPAKSRKDLGLLGASIHVEARDINDAGTVVGFSMLPPTHAWRASVWRHY